MLGALGLEVTRLIRVSYGPFQLGELAEGEVQELRAASARPARRQADRRIGRRFRRAEIVKEFSNQPVAQRRSAERTRCASAAAAAASATRTSGARMRWGACRLSQARRARRPEGRRLRECRRQGPDATAAARRPAIREEGDEPPGAARPMSGWRPAPADRRGQGGRREGRGRGQA